MNQGADIKDTFISGIGIIYNRGRGIESFVSDIEKGYSSPEDRGNNSSGRPFYRVSKEILTDRDVLSGIRRADRFSKISVLAAYDAVKDSGLDVNSLSDTGIILSTGFGPHATTFRFLDDILDYGESNVSPTTFSHSVHNAAASYIARVTNMHGPILTLTQFSFPFHRALTIADTWLKEKRCSHVLVGYLDELSSVMEYVCSKKLRISHNREISPFSFSPSPYSVPGEGGVFFLLTSSPGPDTYCIFDGVYSAKAEEGDEDILILDTDGFSGDETVYNDHLRGVRAKISAYSPLFGGMIGTGAFNSAAGAYMLREQRFLPSPSKNNPLSIHLCSGDDTGRIDTISTLKYDCYGEMSAIKLKKQEG